MQRRILWIAIGGGIILIAFAGLALTSNRPNTGRTTRDVARGCTTDMATQFHIHPKLKILVNGNEQTIPANIGIDAGCMHPLHTHDTSGTIHVESPERRDFTLADFFAVWGKSFSREQILDAKTDATHRIRLTVNGSASEGYENLVLHDDDVIIISYEEIPSGPTK